MTPEDEAEVRETIRSTLKQMLENGNTEFSDDAMFYEDVGADSIAIVQVFLTCQDRYGVMLADELNLMEPVSVNSLTALIAKKLAEKE